MDAVQHFEEKLAWWVKQHEAVTRERAQMKWVLVTGIALALAATLWRPLVGLAVGGVALFTWGMGLYMTAVRRAEYAEKIREAQRDLQQARTMRE